MPETGHRVQESGCRVGERAPTATVCAPMNHVRDRALRSGGGGGVRPADAPLRVAALRERSGVGFSAGFTRARGTVEKRIERDV